VPQAPRDEAREERITVEIIVDAYGPDEQAMGWYSYLDNQLQVPRCAPRQVQEEALRRGLIPYLPETSMEW
jgi:Calcium binding